VSAAHSTYFWWLAGRSAGIVAMLAVTTSVLLGLAMAARLLPARTRKSAVRLHEHIALIALGAIAAHGLLLSADPWLKTGLKGIFVPFAIHYRPLWIALGIVGGYLAALLALSFYVRRSIGPRTWRRMHRLTVVVYALALAHTLGAGTDASIPIVREVMLASALPVLVLFVIRIARSRARSAGTARSEPRSPPVAPTQGARAPSAATQAHASTAVGRQARGHVPRPGGLDAHPSRAL